MLAFNKYGFVQRVVPVLLIIAVVLIGACRHKRPDISFYYWKTGFGLKAAERRAMAYNNVRHLYVRYFDVVNEDGGPVPVGVLSVDSFPHDISITPVVFIKNEVFRQAADSLPEKVMQLVGLISSHAGISPRAIQFDCDWTDATRERYFRFLRRFKAIFPQEISATIRLHQVKYRMRTGIPPVAYGVLMYYNMGTIGGTRSSVYDCQTAARYLPYLKTYPLRLDLALPVFGWSIQMRNGGVVELLNEVGQHDFEGDTSFRRVRENHFYVRHSLFKGGYYLREGDVVKCEFIDEATLRGMAAELRNKFREAPREVIFYDLDSPNLAAYHEATFKEVAGNIR